MSNEDFDNLFKIYLQEIESKGGSKEFCLQLKELNHNCLSELLFFSKADESNIINYLNNKKVKYIVDVEDFILENSPQDAEISDMIQHFSEILMKQLFCITKKTNLFNDDVFFHKEIYSSKRTDIVYKKLFLCNQNDLNKTKYIIESLIKNNNYEYSFNHIAKALLCNENIEHLKLFFDYFETRENSKFAPIYILEDFPALSFSEQVVSTYKFKNFSFLFEKFYDDIIWSMYQLDLKNSDELNSFNYGFFYKMKFYNVFSNYHQIERILKNDDLIKIKEELINKYSEVYDLNEENLINIETTCAKLVFNQIKENENSRGLNGVFKRRKKNLLNILKNSIQNIQNNKDDLRKVYKILNTYHLDEAEYNNIKLFTKMSSGLSSKEDGGSKIKI